MKVVMKIEELMTREVRSCISGDNLDTAAHSLWESDCGCLPVLAEDDSGRVVGMLTDRDICMAALFSGKPLREICVEQAMANEVHCCSPIDSPRQVLAVMREAHVRRAPVVDASGRLVGLVSLADLARVAGRRRGRETPVTKAALTETFAAITAERRERRGHRERARPEPANPSRPTGDWGPAPTHP
jgi:CBS domain-containing protein